MFSIGELDDHAPAILAERGRVHHQGSQQRGNHSRLRAWSYARAKAWAR